MLYFNFNLMINFLAARMTMIIKSIVREFGPPDRHCQVLMNKFDLMNKLNFDLMKKKFDLLKKLNFNPMKFDLLTLSRTIILKIKLLSFLYFTTSNSQYRHT
jgi:hypothetical protein